MKSGTHSDTVFDVLVVGAGPSGLLLACELLSRKIRVRIVDKAPEPMHVPRALSIYPRALDILEDQGLREAVYEISGTVRTLSYFSDRNHLASFHIPEEHTARVLPQYETERLLTERLEALGGKVERGVRLLCLEDVDYRGRIDGAPHATAVLEGPDGLVERATASFVVGADGAGSAVRGQLGIGFQGSTYGLQFALVDAKVDGALSPEEILYYQDPAGTLAVVPQPGGVFRFLSVLPEGSATAGVAMMQDIVDERGPRGIRITEPVWTTVFRVHARLAADFQLGRVFLIGDAAHVHSPAGGQGMNNGLQDAHNLGWKLASVIHGTSPVSLLATYGPERAEATSRSVRDTDFHTKAWMAKGRTRVWARDAGFRLADRTGAVARFYAPVLAGRRQTYTPLRGSQLPSGWSPCQALAKLPGGVGVGGLFPREHALAHGMAGPGTDPPAWTLAVTDASRGAEHWRDEIRHLAARWPQLRVVTLPRWATASATGCRRTGYHLLRPDSHIAAHGHDTDLNRLEAELATALVPREAERRMTLHVGAQLPVNSIPGYGDHLDLVQVARHAEALGLDSVWTGDRLSAPFPVLDSSLVLATAAAATERIKVGYGVLLLALRSSAWAAKQIGTLQQLSRGRVLLGVGVGSGDETEWAAAGLSPRGRGRRTEQLLRLLPGLLAGEPTELGDQPGRPRVTLSPSVPMPDVWIGGGSDTALRRVVTHGQGWLATMRAPKQLARAAARLAELAAEHGVPAPRVGTNVFVRMTKNPDPAAAASVAGRLSARYGMDRAAGSEIALGGSPQQVAERLWEYVEAGAEHFVLVPMGDEDDDTFRQYELFAETRALLLRG